ncbi:MAG: hypothetical protein AAFU64_15955, partial [Bacteroidota bacterium]
TQSFTNENTVLTEFNALSGTTYYIRIIRPDETTNGDTGADMLGYICAYRSDFRSSNDFFTANVYDTDGDNCGEQFNILGEYNSTGGTGISTLSPYDPTEISQRDAWATFSTDATPSDLIIEYDNNNNSPTLNNNVALLLYEGESTAAALNTVTIGDNITAAIGNGSVDALVNQTFTFDIPNTLNNSTAEAYAFDLSNIDTERDGWVLFSKTDPTTSYSLVYENFTNDSNLEILQDDGFGGFLSLGSGRKEGTKVLAVISGAVGDYYIRVSKQNDPADMLGELSIIELREVHDGFSEGVSSEVEGIERIDVLGDSLEANTNYYIRVVNITEPAVGSSATTTTGTLCIRNNVLTEGDICSVALPVLVGDCDVNFDLTTDFTRNDITEPNCILGLGGAYREGWMRFTATSGNTTIEYLNEDEDAAFAV